MQGGSNEEWPRIVLGVGSFAVVNHYQLVRFVGAYWVLGTLATRPNQNRSEMPLIDRLDYTLQTNISNGCQMIGKVSFGVTKPISDYSIGKTVHWFDENSLRVKSRLASFLVYRKQEVV